MRSALSNGRQLALQLLVVACAFASAGRAFAQAPPAAPGAAPDAPSIKIGVTIFADYTFTKEPESIDAAGNVYSPSVFQVTRAYLNVTGNVNHFVRFRITPDIARETGTGPSLAGSQEFRLKYAYAQFGLDGLGAALRGAWVRLGLQPTPYLEMFAPVYRYRFQGTPYEQRDGGIFSSDNGVSFHAELPRSYGDVQVGLFNGEGYQKPEVNDQKALMARGTLRPMPGHGAPLGGLRVTGFYINDHYAADAERKRAIGSVLYEQPHINAGASMMSEQDRPTATSPRLDAHGYSLFATPFFKTKGEGPEALIRFDSFRPDLHLEPVRHRVILGAAYWFPHPAGSATTALMLDFEQVTQPAAARQRRLAVHCLVDF